jgi:hypothetical protein
MRELGPADSSARGDTTMTLLFDSRSRGSCANGFKHRLYRALLTFVRCQNDGAGTVLRQGAARAAEQYIATAYYPPEPTTANAGPARLATERSTCRRYEIVRHAAHG